MGKKKTERLNLALPAGFHEYMDDRISKGGAGTYSELVIKALKVYGRLSDDMKAGKKIFTEDDKGNRTEYLIL